MAKKNEKTTAKKIQKKREMDKETLENTMKIRIDRERLEDSESLDTSFLEGRVHKKAQDNKKVKEEILREKKESGIPFSVLKILLALVLLIIIIFVFQIVFITPNNREEEVIKEDNVVHKEDSIIDRNYLFVGDILTKEYDLKEYYSDSPVVNSSNDSLTTHELYDNLKNYIYIYNPSKVFIEVGTFDFTRDDSTVTIVKYISSIIKEIKNNRPFAEIYVESIYPINDSDDEIIKSEEVDGRTNAVIENANKSIKEICEENDVTYIDLYSDLYSEEDEGLKLDYTTDGFHLSDEGYNVITTKIKRYLK